MKNINFLATAYMFIWLCVVFYLIRLSHYSALLKKELDELKKEFKI
jgi:CcmD family protein